MLAVVAMRIIFFFSFIGSRKPIDSIYRGPRGKHRVTHFLFETIYLKRHFDKCSIGSMLKRSQSFLSHKIVDRLHDLLALRLGLDIALPESPRIVRVFTAEFEDVSSLISVHSLLIRCGVALKWERLGDLAILGHSTIGATLYGVAFRMPEAVVRLRGYGHCSPVTEILLGAIIPATYMQVSAHVHTLSAPQIGKPLRSQYHGPIFLQSSLLQSLLDWHAPPRGTGGSGTVVA